MQPSCSILHTPYIIMAFSASKCRPATRYTLSVLSGPSKFRQFSVRQSGQVLLRDLADKSFSQSGLTLLSRRQVLVELTDDVKGLGQICETCSILVRNRVFVESSLTHADDRLDINPGRARNELVPTGAARMIPWKRRAERERLMKSTRSTNASRLPTGVATDGQSQTTSNSSPTPQIILDTLYSLPPSIVFHRRTTAPSAGSIHGSLSLSDIQQRLQDEYGLRAQDVEVTWKDDPAADVKLRQLGNYDCVITVRGHGQEAAPLGVEIVRLHE